jgi:hypothetical protein
VDPPAAELDEHEDLQGPEPGGLHGEEVAGDDPVRLGPQELGPRRAAASRGGPRSRSSEQGPDRRRAHSEAELPQLAFDPDATPSRVLPGEPQNERPELRIDRGPARTTSPAIGPLPLHQLAVPAEELAGVTRKATHRSRGRTRLAAASRTRSIGRSLGGPAVRWNTRSWWRRTRISRSLAPASRSPRPPLTSRRTPKMPAVRTAIAATDAPQGPHCRGRPPGPPLGPRAHPRPSRVRPGPTGASPEGWPRRRC